jgi:hypothetical protein
VIAAATRSVIGAIIRKVPASPARSRRMALECDFRLHQYLQPEVIRSSAGSPSQLAIPMQQTPPAVFGAWQYVLSRRTDRNGEAA